MRPLNLAHQLIKDVLTADDLAIDATCGNGHDTLFLAQRARHVYAFDIQPSAMASTRTRLAEHNLAHRVTLINSCHSHMSDIMSQRSNVKAAMFNLGYLPGSDKSIITTPETTIMALNTCLELLATGGLITIMVYPRHDGGRAEADAILTWSRNHNATIYGDQHDLHPFLITIKKR